MRCPLVWLIPDTLAIDRSLSCVAFGGISPAVLDSTLRVTAADSGFLPGGRVL
jgi:hypothetical protein